MTNINLKNVFYSNFSYILGILTLSLSVFKLGGYSFSIANILVLFLFFIYLNKTTKIIAITYFTLILYFVTIAIFFIENLDFLEFIKSFSLTSVMLLVFITSLFKPIYTHKFNINKIITVVGLLIVLFEIVQIGEYIFLGSSNTWFIFEGLSISTATDIGRFQAVNFLSFMRPISFYHEPSYLGIVLLILLICANELKINKIFIFVYFLGIILSFSTTALIFLVTYIFLINISRLKNTLWAFLFILIILLLKVDNETLDNIFRFSEILNTGTSGNERLIGPYDYLVNEIFIKKHYLGIPLGQSDLIFNNSFYLLFLYFGILTPFIILIFIAFVILNFKSNSYKYLIAFFSLLFLNGAIFTLESALILYCLNYTFVSKKQNTSQVVIARIV